MSSCINTFFVHSTIFFILNIHTWCSAVSGLSLPPPALKVTPTLSVDFCSVRTRDEFGPGRVRAGSSWDSSDRELSALETSVEEVWMTVKEVWLPKVSDLEEFLLRSRLLLNFCQ